MKLLGGVLMRGHVKISDGNTGRVLKDCHNVVVCGGSAFMAGYLSGGTMTAMSAIAVGSGSTGAVTADTALESEIGGVANDRHIADRSAPTSTSVKFSANFGAGHATGNWYEVGIFNASGAAGLMLCRSVFGLLTKAAGDTFIIEYTVSFADDGA